MKNILFSTTRQWNPGDEFILLGVRNLLKEVIGEFNSIIYNRNPEVRQNFNYKNPFRNSKYCNKGFRGKSRIESFFRIGFWDNSFKDEMELDFIDMVVFAGSPEWMSGRLLPLYEKLLNYNKPILFLGIGSGNKNSFENIKSPFLDVLKKAKLITVRDSATYEFLKPLNPHLLPCPALFSSEREKNINKIKKIGLIFATHKAVVNNRVSEKTYNYMMKLYDKILENYNCELVCHYIDELPEIDKKFKGINYYYSYDSKDYLDIFSKFDFVIGPRVHGIGMSASLGIPGILISHDLRGETGKGFLAEIIDIDTNISIVLEKIKNFESNIEEKNKQLIKHKSKYKKIFIDLIRNIIK